MQLRMSPGGSTSNSRRSRPELPPSSLTVTIAVMSSCGAAPSTTRACSFRPERSAERPVPPPMATTLRGDVSSMEPGRAELPVLLLGVEQGIEGRLAGQRCEIHVLPRHDAIARLDFDGTLQVVIGACDIARKRLRQRQRVVHMIGPGGHLQRFFEIAAC